MRIHSEVIEGMEPNEKIVRIHEDDTVVVDIYITDISGGLREIDIVDFNKSVFSINVQTLRPTIKD
jgi:hypothetical protein